MAYEVMSDAEFVILAGHAAMIRPVPGPAYEAGAGLTQWKKSDDMKTLEKAGSIALRGILLSLIPDRMVALLLDGYLEYAFGGVSELNTVCVANAFLKLFLLDI